VTESQRSGVDRAGQSQVQEQRRPTHHQNEQVSSSPSHFPLDKIPATGIMEAGEGLLALPPPPPLDNKGWWDISGRIPEEAFNSLAVYIVPDVEVEGQEEDKAERSLPKNLRLSPSQVTQEVSTETNIPFAWDLSFQA
jgi:hypothetical protein